MSRILLIALAAVALATCVGAQRLKQDCDWIDPQFTTERQLCEECRQSHLYANVSNCQKYDGNVWEWFYSAAHDLCCRSYTTAYCAVDNVPAIANLDLVLASMFPGTALPCCRLLYQYFDQPAIAICNLCREKCQDSTCCANEFKNACCRNGGNACSFGPEEFDLALDVCDNVGIIGTACDTFEPGSCPVYPPARLCSRTHADAAPHSPVFAR